MLKFEPFLLEDENLLGSCGTGRGFICATDLRLLRVERTIWGRRIRDLSYREISSISVLDRVDPVLIVVGMLLLGLGVAAPTGAPRLLAYLEPARPLRLTTLGAQSLLFAGAALALVGAAMLLYGLLQRRSYVALDGPFLLRRGAVRRHWRFPMPTPSDARVFAGLVRKQIAQSGDPGGKKVLRYDAY